MAEIDTPHLHLTPMCHWHLEDIHRLYNDPFVNKSMFFGISLSIEAVAAEIRRNERTWAHWNFGFWVVFEMLGKERKFVGRSGLQRLLGTTEVEFGHCYLPEATGRGIAIEAGQAVLDYGFNKIGLSRIVAIVGIGNVRSLKCAKKLGLRYLRDEWYEEPLLQGRTLAHYLELTAKDFDASQAEVEGTQASEASTRTG